MIHGYYIALINNGEFKFYFPVYSHDFCFVGNVNNTVVFNYFESAFKKLSEIKEGKDSLNFEDMDIYKFVTGRDNRQYLQTCEEELIKLKMEIL